MSYDIDTEFSDQKDTEKKLQDIQDQIYEIESFPTENVTSTGPNMIGKIRTKDNTQDSNDNVPDGTAQFQHLEWSGSAWIAQQALAFGINSADVGQIKFQNNSIGIAWRNSTNDGNIEIKVNTSDFLDITNSANDTVGIFLRAQDEFDLDISSSWIQKSNIGGLGGSTELTYPTELAINHGATLIALFDSTDEINFFEDVDFNKNALILNFDSGAVIASFASGIQFFTDNFARMVLNDDAMLMGVDIDAAGFSLNNLLSLDIEDSAGNTKLGISGPLGVGARFSFVSGDTILFTENILDRLSISATGLDVFSGSILDIGFLESSDALLPESGFIRMGTGEEIRMRNPVNNDDLIITSGIDALSNQAMLFQVAGGDRFTISQFDIDVKGNDIINTGDVLPQLTGGEVGDATNFYNQMHSQYFIPEGSSIINSRFGLAKTGNELYVNFDNTNIDAGFAIREQGLQRFLFSRTGSAPFVNEFFIGGDPFTAGEEYRIQMGENSNSSVSISFVEGVADGDIIIDRKGIATTGGFQTRSGGLTTFIVNSLEAKFFNDVNVNNNNIINLLDPVDLQDAATKNYVDNIGPKGIQDVKLSTDHETSEFDFEIWMSNSKQGNVDDVTNDLIHQILIFNNQYFLPVYIGERAQILRIGIDIDFLDAGGVSMAIYDTHPNQNYPRQRIGNVQTGILNTTGIFDLFFAQNLEAGLYWISIRFDEDAENTTIQYHKSVNTNCVGWRPLNGNTGRLRPISGFVEVNNSFFPLTPEDDMALLDGSIIPAVFLKMVPNTS